MDKDKMVFVHLTNMEFYKGHEQNVFGGGEFVNEHGYGHEMFNFRDDNGKCYGYMTPHGKANLETISRNEISQDILGKYIDGVLVIFTCEGRTGQRVIAGFYQEARIYETVVQDDRENRYFVKNDEYIKYNIICDVNNALLINRADRNFIIPHSRANEGSGHGQHNLWYASNPNDEDIKNKVVAYLTDYTRNRDSDERKHHLYNENNPRVVTSTQIARSQRARKECISLKGCYCNICGFDFVKAYGNLGNDYIEVHHIVPIGELSSSDGYQGTNPEIDLIPLCSNCHSMIHRKNPPYQPEEIKNMLNS